MILSVTLNPCIDYALFVEGLKTNDTNRVTRTEMDAGGKGINLSRVAATMGARTVATGFLGGSTGDYIRHVLDRGEVGHDFHRVETETRTNFSIEDGSDRPPTTLNARGGEVTPAEWSAFIDLFRSLAPKADWVCLCGSLPPGIPPDAYLTLGSIAKAVGAKVLLDADNEALIEGLKARPNLIKPNDREAARLLGTPVDSLDQAAIAAVTLLERLDDTLAVALISRGAEGAVMATSDGVFEGISPKIEPRSTIGSGDSMLGALLASITRGDSWPAALQWGLAGGAATATTDGSSIGAADVVELLWNEAIVRRLAS